MAVDVDRTKSLGRLREIVGADTKLVKDGREWVALCPFHADRKPSLRIFLGKDGHERYHCFACQADGDVLDYVMQTRGVSFQEAAVIIAGEDTAPSGRARTRKPIEAHDPYKGVEAIVPIPKGTKAIKVGERIAIWNPKRERFTNYQPTLAHLYRNEAGAAVGYVLRQDMADGRKITPMVQWCSREGQSEPGWSHFTFARPRPLYGIERIKKQKQIVIVEGEKTADAAYKMMGPATAVISWSGGGGAVEFSDWGPLEDRDVIIVPDADEPGRDAAERIAAALDTVGAKRVRVVDTSEMEATKKGWDLADVEWSRKDTLKWLSERAKGWAPPQPPVEVAPERTGQEVESAAGGNWADNVIWNTDGTPKATSQHNYTTFLRHHPDFEGVFRFNEFAMQVTLTRCPPWEDEDKFKPRNLTDEDVTFCQGQLEKNYGLSPRYDGTRKAIIAAASKSSFHPARDFFTALRDKWDGEKRLDNWLSYYLGVKPDPFSSIVGRKWLIAAVRRVFEPGCKFDSMLILEGPQEIGKSLALRALATFGGVSYFTDGIGDIQRKEAAMTMHGVLIVELAELDALSKAETTYIKSWITRQEDSYRPPYAATIRKAPRQCVLSGTVNPEGGYLKDSTGNRRFWPVWCTSVDLKAIAHDREQLWAEAVVGHFGGEPLYLEGDEMKVAREAQEDRYQDDVWASEIDNHCNGNDTVIVRDILADVLQIPAERRNVLQEKRVIRHLTNRGWKRAKEAAAGELDYQGKKKKPIWVFISPEEQRSRGL